MNVPVKNMEGLAESNLCYTRKRITFTDIRGDESLFSLDRTGFEVGMLNSALQYRGFDDPVAMSATYFAEVRRFLMDKTGCSHVFLSDYQAYSVSPPGAGDPAHD